MRSIRSVVYFDLLRMLCDGVSFLQRALVQNDYYRSSETNVESINIDCCVYVDACELPEPVLTKIYNFLTFLLLNY